MKHAFIIAFLIIFSATRALANCVGRFVNPMTDICWKCIFPITIAGLSVASGEDTPNSRTAVCFCKDPPRVGIPISFWEPARLVDITRTPYCMVNLGGVKMGPNKGVQGRGNPAAALFGNPIAQTACVADCAAASLGFSYDALFWCAGCQGSMYPFTGTVSAHSSGVQASLLLTQRFIAKLHREGLLWGYAGLSGLCGKYPMPLMRKSQYKTQMTYPTAQTSACHPLGRSDLLWSSGTHTPVVGEDFGYLIWRKRSCCLL